MVPKQVLDVVNLANSSMNSSKNLQCHLELDTLSTSTHQATEPVKSQPMQIFLNIEIDGCFSAWQTGYWHRSECNAVECL